jgi:esterase/lipase superfamily enzyme
VAITRERENSSENVFTANRANVLNFARLVVSVSPNHKSGDIEMPTTPDPQSSFAIVDRAVMSEADFRKAVASQGDTRRKKHKAFVLVQGFNNNFQEALFRLTRLQADTEPSDYFDLTPIHRGLIEEARRGGPMAPCFRRQ